MGRSEICSRRDEPARENPVCYTAKALVNLGLFDESRRGKFDRIFDSQMDRRFRRRTFGAEFLPSDASRINPTHIGHLNVHEDQVVFRLLDDRPRPGLPRIPGGKASSGIRLALPQS
jgi:hypothetical protein